MPFSALRRFAPCWLSPVNYCIGRYIDPLRQIAALARVRMSSK